MLPLAQFSSFIEQNRLFKPDERVLLAVSGGRDSVLMAHLFKASGYKFGIAHVNFQLRGAESDADEAFCRQLAGELSVPFYESRFDTLSYAREHQLSVQMAARHLRYHWLESIREENQFDYIALAHHQDDSAETILWNLVRGTGISGLHGILPKRARLIRPLMGFKRAEIDEWLMKASLSYRDDSSNESVKYARNKIRLEVIPILKELNPALAETFEANSRRFSELEELLHMQVEALRSKLFLPSATAEFSIDLPALKALRPLNTLLFELFRPYGFTEAVLSSLASSWDGQPGKIFESATHRILLDRHQLILSPIRETLIPAVEISALQKEVSWNRQHFTARLLDIAGFKLEKDPAKAQLDAGMLVFPLTLRSRRSGDVFHPFGMKGQKKLSDFLIAQKIPLHQKNEIGILQNTNGDILWVAGFRIDDRYKVSANTKKVFILEQVQQVCQPGSLSKKNNI